MRKACDPFSSVPKGLYPSGVMFRYESGENLSGGKKDIMKSFTGVVDESVLSFMEEKKGNPEGILG